MNTIVKSSNGITTVSLDSRLLAEGKVYIHGPITEESACEFDKQIDYLKTEYPGRPITIIISSRGGEVDAGFEIYDIIKSLEREIEVNIICKGEAYSMAAIILAGGKKGHRFILPHGKVMIHEPLIEGGVSGNATTIKRTTEQLMEERRRIIEALAKDTEKTKKEIEAAISYDHFMNASEAIAFGIVDSIMT